MAVRVVDIVLRVRYEDTFTKNTVPIGEPLDWDWEYAAVMEFEQVQSVDVLSQSKRWGCCDGVQPC